LKAFQLADALAIQVYRATRGFPKNEQFGLSSQMRRAAVSIPSNIVEGSARSTEADYLRFLEIAHGSAREIDYQVTLVQRLGYLDQESAFTLHTACVEVSKVLNGLIRSLR
jgi:four helix bundle protein